MSNPVIGYDNIFEQGTLSASSEATGFDAENAVDWLTYDFWKPTGSTSENIAVDLGSPQSIDYVGIYAHDADVQGSTLTLQGASNAGFTTGLIAPWSSSPSDGKPIVASFTATATRQYWRLLTTGGTAATSIGVLAAGVRLDMPDGMPVGFVPPTMSFDDVVLNNNSIGGAFIGRSVRRLGAKGNMRFDLMTPAWVRSDWLPFLEHAREKPFFLSWDETNYPAEAAYCWTDKAITPPRYSHPNWMQAALDFRGLTA